MSKKKSMTIVTALFASSIMLAGCGLFGNEQEIDPPQKETIVDDSSALENESNGETTNSSEETAANAVTTELYLIDKNGYVVPQSISLPSSEGVAKQAMEHLVEGGPVSNVLPNGFRAVLPADTQVDVNIKDGVATVDFSPEFANYQAEDEMRILQAITWTLTQFDSVESVKIQMNGYDLQEMPVNKTPITKQLTRAGGINLDTADINDITNTVPLTVYYIGGEENSYYYVPVTKRVSSNQENIAEAVIEELAKGPASNSHLLTEFMPDLALLDEPVMKDGNVSVNFNENIYGSFEEEIVSQRLIDALVLSLTEQADIESVEVLVNGEASLKLEDGKDLSEPVNRPEKVNSSSL
ncbi:MAG: GerMN domain-containing protein [Bacillus sp. (in: firmicutes)]